ncbi:carotenoid ester lipase precursor [Epithele typhae]|uniref:carotenoid ester lipase precursor n=1 Tax=Epithele typhae TaxID=378194 RepID=UPI002008A047|nr:carotenoid ester lipase precursor [Epithele typhae]KAH9932737.1 carotenoid ester lipase precursor [Epithele typhae]
MLSIRFLCLPLLLAATALAAPTAPDTPVLEKRTSPKVTLDKATFVGTGDGSVNKFLGIPFAKAPVGNLRFNLPAAVDPYNGTQTATAFGPACPQQALSLPVLSGVLSDAADTVVNGFLSLIEPSAEDCLSLNVMVPDGTKAGDNLPVAVWIFGGGFEIGGTNIYDGGGIVKRSAAMKSPMIFVSMNYRVSAYGFLASKEVKAAGVGNLGLQDQRLALQWVQKYITQFGGDPSKVTIWGESAGAISIALHMVSNGGDPQGLFRGAFMESGSPIPVGDIEHGQGDYDALVSQTGCTGAADTLQCLREVDFSKLKKAVDASPSFFSFQALKLAWIPRVDGVFLTQPSQQLVVNGSVAKIPFVSGDCEDEGTLFSLSSLNVTTDAGARSYIKDVFTPNATDAELDKLLSLYPSTPSAGSPFGTGAFNAITPQFKRIAAFQGDLVFNAARRFFLQQRAADQPVYSFLSKRFKVTPVLGAFHVTDVLNVFGGGELTDYLINFTNNLDPNGPTVPAWPQYTVAQPQLMTFLDGFTPTKITTDDFRKDAMSFVIELSLKYPL